MARNLLKLNKFFRLSNVAPRIFAKLDVGTNIELAEGTSLTTQPHCYWQVTRQMSYINLPHVELTNIDTGARKVLSIAALHGYYKFRIVHFEQSVSEPSTEQ
mgnify:FL=1